ncbi:hypothetical protein [Lacticaseibacillus camelliae]|uniref:Uncharacterized protein n=1 Tax=Lacticaseibacillus camelliae DSM 22697 = JCM 13995 TaxID=1423730 RepID=A0A0R2F7B4_9LACO|nr:hypothetical protein [Lacticaseibacillus camelliae]KRN21431.1 hypothetical protein FC75_GL002233 [Lacticaseibacillus camelliae DSM 22697 = JCM 13995]
MYQLLLTYTGNDNRQHTFSLNNLAAIPDRAFAEEISKALPGLDLFGLNDTIWYETLIEASVRYTQEDVMFKASDIL